ncbi:NAD(P)-dependent oxidoreductase [Aestuariivirga sp.]|uniref:NAD(P)-dependent oxidoreductase n=1 Tax=Aestuariivirga sp. TaxID=2650926 RepID=UPI0039E5CB4D
MSIKRVGMIGVGLMGHGIAKNIVEKGFDLTVMGHRNRAPVEDLLAKGAKEAKTPAELAKQSDLVILCVTGTPEVEQAVYGESGLLSAMPKGLIIADCSTAEPDSTVKIAADVAANGGHFVDTPMVRTPKEAEAGKLGLMVGGPKDVLAKIRPILDTFADTIVYAGDVGAAHRLKLLNNFIAIANAAVASEAIAVASKAGIDMEALRDIVMSGGAASLMFSRLINVPLSNDDSHAKFAIRNARKDLRYYTNMTETMPVASFMAESTHQLLVMADNLGYGERYVPRLIDVLKKINGIA